MKFKTDIFPRSYWLLLAMLCIAYAWRPLEGGYDFWAHAAVGKWIWLNRSIPRETLFLWSEPGTPWIAHSWLCELLFFGLLARGGPFMVAVFNAAMVALTFFVLWRLWKQRGGTYTFWVPMLFALAIWISAPRFQPRQELISALFLALLLAFLAGCEQRRFEGTCKPNPALSVVGIAAGFALWVNLHALVAVGLLVLLATFAGHFVQTKIKGDATLSCRPLLLALLVAGVLATFLNPYGLYYWTAAGVLQSGSQAQFVQEWKPMWASPAMLEYLAAMALVAVVALAAWIANPNRCWSHFLWLLLATALTLRSRRMLWLAAILFLAVLAANARYLDTPALWKKWRKLTGGDSEEAIPGALRQIARVGALLCVAAWVFSAASRHTAKEAGRWDVYVRNVPEGAVRFLAPKAASIRIFNDYEDSSYLQWGLNGVNSPTVSTQGYAPLYIDLLNAYPDSLMFEYFDILAARPAALQRLEERKINCIVLGEHHWQEPLVRFLEGADSGWKPAWSDSQSKIWMKEKHHAD